MNYISIIIIALMFVFSCKKEEAPIPDYCALGNVYVYDFTVPHFPIHTNDKILFDQSLGVHTLIWQADSFNKLTLSIKKFPDVDSTIVYKKEYVSLIESYDFGLNYRFKNDYDSIVTITNKKDSLIVNINTVYVSNSVSNTQKRIRACNLIMNDVNP